MDSMTNNDDSIVIVIAGAPIAKGRPKHRIIHGKDGNAFTSTYTPSKTRKYEDEVKAAARAVMAGRPPLECAVNIILHVYREMPKKSKRITELMLSGAIRPTTKPDLDNYTKSALDGIDKIVVADDSQVVGINSRKYYAVHPYLSIEVIPL